MTYSVVVLWEFMLITIIISTIAIITLSPRPIYIRFWKRVMSSYCPYVRMYMYVFVSRK